MLHSRTRLTVIAASLLPACASVAPARSFPALVDSGGCRLEQVTAADSGEGQFQFHGPSRDGSRLVVGWFRGTAQGAYLLDLRSGERSPLAGLDNAGAFSPDGSRILVASRVDGANREIVEHDLRTGARRIIASDPTPEFLATYSRDGNSVLFNSYRSGRSDIYLLEPRTGPLRRLTSFDGYDAHADFSPDDREVLFHRQVGPADYDIYLLNLRSGEERLIIGGAGEQAYPAWSPDGRLIAFSSDSAGEAGKTDLYVTDRARRTTVRLTRHPGYNTYPAWSADGRRLYFNAERSGRRNVFRMRFTSSMRCER
jgi:TolB protein